MLDLFDDSRIRSPVEEPIRGIEPYRNPVSRQQPGVPQTSVLLQLRDRDSHSSSDYISQDEIGTGMDSHGKL